MPEQHPAQRLLCEVIGVPVVGGLGASLCEHGTVIGVLQQLGLQGCEWWKLQRGLSQSFCQCAYALRHCACKLLGCVLAVSMGMAGRKGLSWAPQGEGLGDMAHGS
jgi:hypothetical protein